MAIGDLPIKNVFHSTREEHDQFMLNAKARGLTFDEYCRLVMIGVIDDYPIIKENPYAY
jgi:hypothetical protein